MVFEYPENNVERGKDVLSSTSFIKMLTLEEILKGVFEKERQGDYKEALKILEDSMKIYPELYIDLLYEQAMLYFRNMEYYIALLKLIEVYKLYKDEGIIEFIFNTYVNPNQKTYRENYNCNKKLLDDYQLIYCSFLPDNFEDIELNLIWSDENAIIYYIEGEFIQYLCKNYSINEECKKDNLMLVHAFCMDNILEIEEINKQVKIYISNDLQLRNPLYLYFEKYEFITFLCSHNIEPVLKRERVVFLIENESVDAYFQSSMTILPNVIFDFGENTIVEKMKELIIKRKERIDYIFTEGLTHIKEYYSKNEKLIIQHIKSFCPKMLFITSRYTTALQYHAKNLYYAAIKKGLDARFVIEKNSVDFCSEETVLYEIEEFRPDIIVLMDHFRFEISSSSDLWKSVIFLSWIQDPMPTIMDKATPKKLLENDFILNHFISWKDFFDVGYDVNKMINAPIPANQDIYKQYKLTEAEKNKYSCDICLVCHSSTVYSHIESEMKLYSSNNSKEFIKSLYLAYYNQVLYKEEICYTKRQFSEFVQRYYIEQYCERMEEEVAENLGDRMYREFGSKVYRQAMVKWILDAGYKNIKLWGYGWEEEKDFVPYSMGAAGNGEELSKILQASRIVLGNNFTCTSAARAWETMLSGGFYLSNYVPEEYDAINIRMILEEEDYVMFKSKDELLEKIDYYLSNEKDRIKMVVKGRESALQKMTFDILMERILNQLSEKL